MQVFLAGQFRERWIFVSRQQWRPHWVLMRFAETQKVRLWESMDGAAERHEPRSPLSGLPTPGSIQGKLQMQVWKVLSSEEFCVF